MPFCPNCGLPLTDEKFCPQCGTKQIPLSERVAAQTEMPPAGEGSPIQQPLPMTENEAAVSAPVAERNAAETAKAILSTQDETAEYEEQDIGENKLFAVMAYLGVLVLIPIFAKKESRFAQYHANQGLILFVSSIALGLVSSVVLEFLGMVGLGGILSFLVSIPFGLMGLALFALAILGIYNAGTGKAKPLPIIGAIKILPPPDQEESI